MSSLTNLQIDWVLGRIVDWSKNRRYGRIIVSVEDGKIVNLKEEQNLKPPREEEKKNGQ